MKRFAFAGAAALMTILGISSAFGDRGLLAIRRLRAEEARLRVKAESIESENARLRENVRRLHEDDAYLERVARESQGVVREGETVYRFPPE